MTDISQEDILNMTTEMAAAYFEGNNCRPDQIQEVIHNIYESLQSLTGNGLEFTLKKQPAVPIEESINPNFIICLEDGKKLKMLRRHLSASYGLTPDEYRQKWGLPSHYPMVAPNYAKKRSQLAKEIGLGTQKGAKASAKGKAKNV